MCANFKIFVLLLLSLVTFTMAAPATMLTKKLATATARQVVLANTTSTDNSSSSSSNTSTTATTKFNLKWITRAGWQAVPARHVTPINGAVVSSSSNNDSSTVTGVPYVIIHHTATPKACHGDNACRIAVRTVQRAHQQDHGWDDIGYNFLIGGDAQQAEIYEGRGFNARGAHAVGYNARSVGIVLIGNWSDELPPRSLLDKLKQLITYGIQMGYIQSNYTLLAHRQVSATECPGTRLFNEIKQWPHFTQPRS